MTKYFSDDSCSCVWLMLACTGAHIYYDINDLIGGYGSIDICLQEDQDLQDGSVRSLQLKHWPFQVGYSLLLRLVSLYLQFTVSVLLVVEDTFPA